MKKIITALTVTAMALSAAFADVSLEFKQMGHLLSDDLNTNGDTGTLDLFTGYSSTSAGNLKFTVKNSNAGVEFTIKPTLDNAGNAIAWNNYYGWTKFADGKAELRAGRWESRTVNRYNEYAGDYESPYYERYKPGTMDDGTSKSKDINNLTNKTLAAQAKYNLDGAWVTGALIKSTYDATSGINSQSGWAAEFGTEVGEGTKIIVDFKNIKQDSYAFGVFGRNTTLKDGLDFQAGFILDREKTATNTKNFIWAVDFRAKYELGDNLALITMNNLTNNATGADPVFKIWDMVSLAIIASDNATINLTAHWEHKDLMNVAGTEHNNIGTVTLAPMVNYLVGKGVNISGGVNLEIKHWGRPDTATFAIPFVVHVKI